MIKIKKTIALSVLAVVLLIGYSFRIRSDRTPRVEKAPNVLFIMADDLSMGDISPYGSTQVHTPNMERLAKEGLCLDNMFNMVPVCSPTRQSILTGLGPVRSGAYPNHTMIYDGIKTLPVYLQQLGYRTALIGKKHYAPKAAYPFEFLGGRDHDDGEGLEVDLSRAEAYIKKSTDKPFFLMFTSNQPHEPWNRGNQKAYHPDEIKLKPGMIDTKLTRKRMANYFAEISYLDSLVGVCLDMVERSGQEQNTIVIFTTEQGNSFPFSKWTLYDQGLHAGFIVKWPGKVQPNTRNKAMLSYTDILPTLIDIAGGHAEKINTGSTDALGRTGFDGTSFMNVLTGGTTRARDYVFAEHTTRGIIQGSEAYASRSARSANFLYIQNLNYEAEFSNTVTHSKMFQQWLTKDSLRAAFYTKRPQEELYDINQDPYSLKNLADDVNYSSIKKKLKEKLKEFMYQQGDKGIETEMKALSRQPKGKED